MSTDKIGRAARRLLPGLAATVALAAVLGSATPARAQATITVNADHAGDLFVYSILGWNQLGLGGQVAIPIAPRGIIPTANDALYVVLGSEIASLEGFGVTGRPGVTALGGLRYQVYASQVIAPYVTLLAGYTFDVANRLPDVLGEIYLDPGIGTEIFFGRNIAARLGFGYHGFNAGVSFGF